MKLPESTQSKIVAFECWSSKISSRKNEIDVSQYANIVPVITMSYIGDKSFLEQKQGRPIFMAQYGVIRYCSQETVARSHARWE